MRKPSEPDVEIDLSIWLNLRIRMTALQGFVHTCLGNTRA
jgi:hypothetical protein